MQHHTSEPSTSTDLDDQIRRLSELHQAAGQVFGQRELLKELDERRQRMREAERELRKKHAPRTTWMTFGQTSTFIEFPTATAIDITARDRKMIDETIEETRNDLKKCADTLLKLENERGLEERGFMLKNIHS